jgi:hypothetical protein
VDASQNVGIGTSSPAQKLHLASAGGTYMQVQNTTASIISYFGTSTAGGVAQVAGAYPFSIFTNGSERLTVDSSGNVGIGVSPSYRLQVYGASPDIVTQHSGANGTRGAITSDNGAVYISSTYSSSGVPIIFTQAGIGAGGAERMRLDTSGNLLVGKTSTGFTTQGIEFRANGSSYITSTLTDTLTLYNKTSTSGDSILAGYSNVTSTAAVKFLIQASGTCLNATGTYGTYSDAKLKENIVDASSKLEKIMDLQVRNYNLIGDDLKQIGFVAQEFEQVFPSMVEETVDKDADGVELGTTTKAIKTTVLIPVLVKAIQEQQALITQLQADVAALKGASA